MPLVVAEVGVGRGGECSSEAGLPGHGPMEGARAPACLLESQPREAWEVAERKGPSPAESRCQPGPFLSVSPQLRDDELCSAVLVARHPARPHHRPGSEPGQEHRGLPAVALGHPVSHEHQHRAGHQNQPLHRGAASEDGPSPPLGALDSPPPAHPKSQHPWDLGAGSAPPPSGVEILLFSGPQGSWVPSVLKQRAFTHFLWDRPWSVREPTAVLRAGARWGRGAPQPAAAA